MTNDLQNVFSDIASLARKEGAEVELNIGNSESFSATYQERKLKKYSADTAQTAVWRVLLGKGTGVSSTENLQADALKQAYSEALQSAKDLNKGAAKDKLEPALIEPKTTTPLPELFYSDYSEVPTPQKLAWAAELERAALDFDQRVTNVPYSGIGHSTFERLLFNSKGIALNFKTSAMSAYCYALAKSGDDSKMGGLSRFSRRPDILNTKAIAEEAATRSVQLLGASQPKTGKWNIIFSREVAAQFIGLVTHHFSAKAMDEGVSLLAGKKGQHVFSKVLSWTDDPFMTELSSARPFDAEGAPSQKTSLVQDGRIENYLTNSYYARKMKLPHTAHASRGEGELNVSATNLIVKKGQQSLDNLIGLSGDVILIKEVQAIHSGYKQTTGDFSLPASGFLYRKGENIGPVHQFVISGNIVEMLSKVTNISDTWNDNGDCTLSPDLFVPEFSLAGKN